MEQHLENTTSNEVIQAEYRVVDEKDFNSVEEFIDSLPDIVHPLLFDASKQLERIEGLLVRSPVLINVIKAIVPEELLVAVFTDEQKQQLAKNALELLTKKDGSLMAVLRDPNTKKFVDQVDLQSLTFSPELGKALVDFSSQMQIAQLADKIENLQIAVEKVQKGLESDRLASAKSLQQKYKLACSLSNPVLKQDALLRITMDAEDSRNRLMLNQTDDLQFIMKQPKDILRKLFANIKTSENDKTIDNIRSSMLALNMVSVVEALAYQSLGERDSAVLSLEYYGDYMKKTYGDREFMHRLDELDPAEENFWSEYLPDINQKIIELPKKEWFNRLDNSKLLYIDNSGDLEDE